MSETSSASTALADDNAVALLAAIPEGAQYTELCGDAILAGARRCLAALLVAQPS